MSNVALSAIELGDAVVEHLRLSSRSDIHSMKIYWPADEEPVLIVKLASRLGLIEVRLAEVLPS